MRRSARPFFVWKSRFLLGAALVDGEHRRFFDLANWLRGAILAGRGGAVVRQALARMTEHAEQHFAHEEACLIASDCPAFALHRAEHRQFLLALARLNAQPQPSPEQVFALSRDWIVDHILGLDRRHGSWIARPPAPGAI